jgi:hypothetical protein
MSSIPDVFITKYEFALARFRQSHFSLPVKGQENAIQSSILLTTDRDINLFRRTPEPTGSLAEFPDTPWPHYLKPSTRTANVPALEISMPARDPFTLDPDAFMCLLGERHRIPRAPPELLPRLHINNNIVFEYQLYTRLSPELLVPGIAP